MVYAMFSASVLAALGAVYAAAVGWLWLKQEYLLFEPEPLAIDDPICTDEDTMELVALRRPFSFPLGLAAALCASLGGVLSFRGWLGTSLPGHPVVWIVAGLYVAFRLTLNRQAEADRRGEGEDPGPDAPRPR